jgi:hypothetical protein
VPRPARAPDRVGDHITPGTDANGQSERSQSGERAGSLQEVSNHWEACVRFHPVAKIANTVSPARRVQTLGQVDRLHTQPGGGVQITLLAWPSQSISQKCQVNLPVAVVEDAGHGFDECVGVAAGLAALIGLAVDVVAGTVEGVEDFLDAGAGVGVEAPGEGRAVAAGVQVELADAFGLVGGCGAVGVEVGEQAFGDPGEGGGVEAAGGVGRGLLGPRDLVRRCRRGGPGHGGGDDPHLGGADGALGQGGGGGGGLVRGQHGPGQGPALDELRRVLDPAPGLAPGQLKHPGQQPCRGTEPGDAPAFSVSSSATTSSIRA